MPDVALVKGLLEQVAEDVLGDMIVDAAKLAGDQCHAIVKDAAMKMPTVRMALAVGISTSVQMLCETVEFGSKSVDGGEDGETLEMACLALFVELVDDNLKGALRRAVLTVDSTVH